jgi:hypothetical protein
MKPTNNNLPALLGGLLLGVLAVCASGQGQEGPDPAASSVTPPPRPTRTLRDAVSAEKVFDALQKLNAMRQQAGLQAKVAGVPVGVQVESKDLTPKVGGLTPGGWKWLGPANLGGDTLALLPNRKDPRILWAGSAKGGLWHSSSAGESWTVLSEQIAGFPISCLAADPTNPDITYVGTGRGIVTHQLGLGLGLLWTPDGGKTWKVPPETRKFLWINQVAVSADGRVVLAATPVGLMRSTDGTASWKAAEGLGAYPVQNVYFHPKSPEKCIAGSWLGAAYYSTDGGASWKQAEGLPTAPAGANALGRVVLTYSAGGDMVYASVEVEGGRLYRSRDGGQTYTPTQNDQKYLEGGGWLVHSIWAGDPTRPDLVVVGNFSLWRSTDGGKTLEKIGDPEKTEPMQERYFFETIVSHPGYNGTDNRTLYVGSYGGIHRIADITTVSPTGGWQSLNNSYGTTEMVGIAGHAATGTLIAGSETHGTLVSTREGGTEKWTQMVSGNGGLCAADSRDPQCLYGENTYLQLYRSLDGGKKTVSIYKGIADAKNSKAARSTAPFVLDPNDSKVLLAGGKSLWRSTDARAEQPTWKEIKSSIGTLISAVAVARGSSDTIWVGHENGTLFRTSNGTAESPAWKRVNHAQLPRKRLCTRITIDPGNPKRVFVMYEAYATDVIWRTEDGGTTWTVMPINLGNSTLIIPARDLAIHPANPHCLYAATDFGLFASENDGQAWSPTNEGPTGCRISQLMWMDKTLVAATGGRGVFQIDLSGVKAAER